MPRISRLLAGLLAALFLLAGCTDPSAGDHDHGRSEAIAGDKLYIPANYPQQLSKLGLTEVRAFPYFHAPFICVARDSRGQEFAVILDASESEGPKLVKLPVPYEQIVRDLSSQGIPVSTEDDSIRNLHLFLIDGTLYWSFDDGSHDGYFSLSGKSVADPFQSTSPP